MTDRIAGARRHAEQPETVDDHPAPLPPAATRRRHEGAQYAAGRLAFMAQACETFFIVLTFLGYVGAAVEIALGVQEHFTIIPGIALAVGLTASLLPMLLFCRWAQAYAVDLEMRAG